MRKIIDKITVDPVSYEWIYSLNIKNEQNEIEEIYRIPLTTSTVDFLKIQFCNQVLDKQGLPQMTQEEIDYYLDPGGFKKFSNKELSQEEWQRLAGFEVEKIVHYLQ